MLAAIALFATVAPQLAGDPAVQDLDRVLSPPGAGYLLGSDHLGRSMAARLGHASRLSLTLAVVSVLSAAVPGTLLGILAAWRRGWLERILAAIADGVLALPGLLLIVLMTAFAPGEYWPYYVGVSLALWVEYFRVVRTTSRLLLRGPAVEASRMIGFPPHYIVRRHLLPELAPLLSTLMAFGMASSVLALATLGIVGTGLQPPTAELGIMMIELLPFYREAPWLIAQPVLLLAATIVALGLLSWERDPR
jgi:peptide/nickel transport system permease protein